MIMDFGSARFQYDNNRKAFVYDGHTPFYSSPELINEGVLNHPNKSDIFSLGVTLL